MFNLKKSGIAAVAVTAVAAMLGSFGLAAPALAADTTPTGAKTDKGSITVSNVQGGATLAAYKVIDVNYTNEGTADAPSYVPTSPQYTWDEAVASWVEAYDAQNKTDYIGDNNEVSSTYANLPNDEKAEPNKDGSYSSDIAKFYDSMSNALGKRKIALVQAGSVTVPGTDDSATASIDNLQVGGYLVKITNASGNTEGNTSGIVADYSYRPVVVTIGFSQAEGQPWEVENATIAAKRDKATIDKTINEQNNDGHNSGKDEKDTGSDTVGIGSIVTYNTRSDVPVFPKDAIEKKYVIADKMDDALTPNYENKGDNKFLVYGVDENGKETEIGQGATSDYYTLTTENATDLDGNAATWVLDFSNNYEKLRQFKKIHVLYTATVNEKAVVGEPIYNNVKLQYTNNPYDEGSHRTVPDKVKVYAFGINIVKKFLENGNEVKLGEGAAAFSVKNNAGTILKFVKDSKGYRPALAGETGVVEDLPVDANGNITVYGIKDGTYTLSETKTPAGYTKINDFQVTLTALKEGEDFNGHVKDEVSKGFVSTEVENHKGWLPKTGSAGMVVMTVAGVLLVAAGVTVLARKRRA